MGPLSQRHIYIYQPQSLEGWPGTLPRLTEKNLDQVEMPALC